VKKPPAESDQRRHSKISGGGGEKDVHHTHEPEMKGGGTRPAHLKAPPKRDAVEHTARQSEFPVSRGGMNQESDHHKHNDSGQAGHKPQKHSPAEEKK
jgi:hypothetical protein